MAPAAPARRTLLRMAVGAVVGGSAVLAGCTRWGGPGAKPSPDAVVTAKVVTEKRSVLEAYAVTLAAHPALAGRLEPLAAEHRAHLVALGASATPGRPPARPTGSAPASRRPRPPGRAPVGTGTAAPPPAAVRDPLVALQRLAERERVLAAGRPADLRQISPGLARLLASIGASEAVHAVALSGPA